MIGSEGIEFKLFELSDMASISFVKTEDYNRCCMHHVRLHRRRCPACCLCRGYPNICRSLPSIFSTIPLATSASASGNTSTFIFAQPWPRPTFRANAYRADSKPTLRRVVRQALTLLSMVLRSIHPAYSFI
ncbi:hypothetical protein M405DRAFT_603163 [Rhizopogon salebrosus TDB-379]|nr:hypothetical protein M405DRAFT_603163 [Rhizopogon salebrosus TDB-379]